MDACSYYCDLKFCIYSRKAYCLSSRHLVTYHVFCSTEAALVACLVQAFARAGGRLYHMIIFCAVQSEVVTFGTKLVAFFGERHTQLEPFATVRTLADEDIGCFQFEFEPLAVGEERQILFSNRQAHGVYFPSHTVGAGIVAAQQSDFLQTMVVYCRQHGGPYGEEP